MKLTKVYVVSDPQIGSTLEDCCFSTTMERFSNYCKGGPSGFFQDEHTTVYTTKTEALQDAKARLKAWKAKND